MNDIRLQRTINRTDIKLVAGEILARCAHNMDMSTDAHKLVIDAEKLLTDYINGCFGYLIALESFDFLLDMVDSAIRTRPGVDSFAEVKFAISAVRAMVYVTNN